MELEDGSGDGIRMESEEGIRMELEDGIRGWNQRVESG